MGKCDTLCLSASISANDSKETRERVSKSHQRLVQRLGIKVHPVQKLRFVQQNDIMEEVYKEKLRQEFGDIPTNERFWHMTVSNHFRRCAKALIEDATANEYRLERRLNRIKSSQR